MYSDPYRIIDSLISKREAKKKKIKRKAENHRILKSRRIKKLTKMVVDGKLR